LSIVSIDPMTGISGQTNMMSAVSISVTQNGYLMGTLVETCGGNQATGCAQDLLASVDGQISK
jgi:hypothetical protein